MDKIILIGNGGHAKACAEIIEAENKFKIEGVIANREDWSSDKKFLDYSIIGEDKELEKFKDVQFALIGIGQIKSPRVRIKLFKRLIRLKYILPIIVSPTSILSKRIYIGKGTIIMHHVIVNANSEIGENCIINNKALIEHDAIIGDNCHISTGVIVNGSVEIGNNCFVGSNATIMQGVKIGNECTISAGTFVNKNLEDNTKIK